MNFRIWEVYMQKMNDEKKKALEAAEKIQAYFNEN